MIQKVDPNNPDPELIKKAANLIKGGNLVISPTDTAYMLAANALDEEAIIKVFNFKKRPLSNPIHVVVKDIKEAEKYVVINEYASGLAQKFLPGPLTLILKKRSNIPNILTAHLKTLGIRIPNNQICLELAKEAGLPLTATSVNIAEKGATYAYAEINRQFGNQLNKIAMILDAGELPKTAVSTIVDLTGDSPKILREGPISGKDIIRKLKVKSLKSKVDDS